MLSELFVIYDAKCLPCTFTCCPLFWPQETKYTSHFHEDLKTSIGTFLVGHMICVMCANIFLAKHCTNTKKKQHLECLIWAVPGNPQLQRIYIRYTHPKWLEVMSLANHCSHGALNGEEMKYYLVGTRKRECSKTESITWVFNHTCT